MFESEETRLYARTSSEDQAERGTIQNQVDFGTKYCDLHQLPIAGWYRDDGVTGTLPLQERPEGRRLLEDAKAGKVKLLLIYKLDRLGRTARVILNAVYDLEQYGVKIRSMTEPFDTSTAAGRLLLTVLAGVADMDRETILERLWLGANRAAREGKWLGGIVPYGYIVNEEKCLELSDKNPLPGMDMTEVDVVRLIYHITADDGISTIKIADYLNSLGIPPAYAIAGRQARKGKRIENTAGIWRPARVRNMIVNETYKGIHLYGKRSKKQREIISREVPAIVSEEIWDRAQQVLHNNQLESVHNSKRQYLLRGLIKCGCCSLTYCGTAYSSSQRGCYICNGKTTYRGSLMGKCGSKNLPQDWIENQVWNDCVKFIMSPGEALNQFENSIQENKSRVLQIETERALITKSMDEKEVEKQSILDLYRKKLIEAKDVEQQLQKINIEKLELQSRLDQLVIKMDSVDTMSQRFSSAKLFLDDLREKLGNGEPNFELKREIVKALVHKIIVETKNPGAKKPQANISVQYSFARGILRTDKDSLQQ